MTIIFFEIPGGLRVLGWVYPLRNAADPILGCFKGF